MKKTAIGLMMSVAVACVGVAPARADRPERAEQAQSAAEAKGAFDPQRHMRVREVREGMKGYGLSVFSGTKIERFEVEVISVLRNFNPQHDVILVRCSGANLEHTGSIAGMSGSPIYLIDEQGRARMVGAFAYGWPMMKDPIGGVQPIEYMLRMPLMKREPQPVQPQELGDADRRGGLTVGARPLTWDLRESMLLPGMSQPPRHWPFAGLETAQVNPSLGASVRFADGPQRGPGDVDLMKLRPLATPLMAAGLSPKLMESWGPIFRAYGMMPLQAGGIGGAAVRPEDAEEVALEPGSVMAVPLLAGDVELTAIGTCTEVIGGQVYGFGHPFVSEGTVSLPMGSGRINAVIANLMTSFKIGSLTQVHGTVYTDELPGLAGKMGAAPATVPIALHVRYADGSGERHWQFSSATHARFTPLISAAALSAAVAGVRDLPQYHTLDYELTLEFANGQTLELANTLVNSSAQELFWQVGGPMMAAADNPFERVMIKQITGRVTVTPEAREARVLSVNVPRVKYRPGETVRAFVTYRPFRAEESVLPVEMELPRDLPDGQYVLAISDWQAYLEQEQQATPFRFKAQSINEVFSALEDIAQVRHNALYLRLARQADGVAIGRTAMPHLPSSRRQVMLGSGRSNTTAFVSSTVKTVPMNYVMSGATRFTITVDKDARVEVGGARPEAPEEPAAPREPAAQEAAAQEATAPKAETQEPAAPAEAQENEQNNEQ